MKSLSCLIRPRWGQAPQEKGQQSPQTAEHKQSDNTVEAHATNNKERRDVVNKGTLPQSPQIQFEDLRRKVMHTQDILSQLNTFLEEELPQSEQDDQKATSISTSIALHLADLNNSANALQAILKARKCPSRGSEACPDASMEHPRGPHRLPTPELGDSFDGNSLLHYTVSVRSEDDESATPSLPPSASPPLSHEQPQRTGPPAPQTTQLGAIAPLRLPRRSYSVDCSEFGTDRTMSSSPFEREMRDIDEQINESSSSPHDDLLVGRTRSSTTTTKPPSVSLMHCRRLDLIQKMSIDGTPCRRAFSLQQQTPRGFDSPTIGSLWSSASPELLRGDRIPDGISLVVEESEGAFDEQRQFSTEAKTRRLRSLKRMSSPEPIRQRALKDTMLGENASTKEDEKEEDQPLRMEELMDFLREGNSMRDL